MCDPFRRESRTLSAVRWLLHICGSRSKRILTAETRQLRGTSGCASVNQKAALCNTTAPPHREFRTGATPPDSTQRKSPAATDCAHHRDRVCWKHLDPSTCPGHPKPSCLVGPSNISPGPSLLQQYTRTTDCRIASWTVCRESETGN